MACWFCWFCLPASTARRRSALRKDRTMKAIEINTSGEIEHVQAVDKNFIGRTTHREDVFGRGQDGIQLWAGVVVELFCLVQGSACARIRDL